MKELRLKTLFLDADLKSGGIVIITEGYTSVDNYDFINVVVANEVPEANYAVFARSRGTIVEPKSIQNNDELFSFFYAGYDTEDQPGWAAELTVGSEGEIKAGTVPGYFAFKTMGQDGVANIAFSIHSDMTVRFNQNVILTQDQVEPTVAKYLKVQVGDKYYAMPLHLIK